MNFRELLKENIKNKFEFGFDGSEDSHDVVDIISSCLEKYNITHTITSHSAFGTTDKTEEYMNKLSRKIESKVAAAGIDTSDFYFEYN